MSNRVSVPAGKPTGSMLLLHAGLAVLLVSLSGCGEFACNFGKLDAETVEANIKEEFEAQLGVVPRTVTCPDNVDTFAQGDTFTCEVAAEDGSTVDVDVEMVSNREVQWSFFGIVGHKLEPGIADGVKQQLGVDATVTCPDLVKESIGDTFTCAARAKDAEEPSEDDTASVTVTMTGQGNVEWKLQVGEPEDDGEAPEEAGE